MSYLRFDVLYWVSSKWVLDGMEPYICNLSPCHTMISKNLFLSYFFSPTWRSFTTAFLLLLPSWGFCLEDVEKNDLQPNNPNTKPSKSKWMS